MNYWPGTNIPKSNGNAFTSWKTESQPVESITRQKQRNGLLIDKSVGRKKSLTIVRNKKKWMKNSKA